jgi:hypothetical protein
MWLHNKFFEISITAYNETTERKSGGIVDKGKDTEVSLCVMWFPPKRSSRHTEKGTYTVEKVKFQISNKELEDQSFTIQEGITHVIKDGIDYRVSNILDGSRFNSIQLTEVEVVRKIPVKVVIYCH